MKTAFVSPPRLYLLPSWYVFPAVSQADLGASAFRELPAKLEVLSLHPCLLPRALPTAATPLGCRLAPGQGALQRSNQAALEITVLTILRTIIYGANVWHSPHFTVVATLLMLGVPRCPRASMWVVSRIKSSTPGTWCTSLCKPLVCCYTKQQVSLHKTKGKHPLLFHVAANWQCMHAACSLQRDSKAK